ncbi:uncharacterized protein LOC106867884 [Octopus bimaculoides]|uniref:uncharacterized protein LOC106867884 n=1 Tax=Octopus bimaculoides TaxID=37653 RepID=UPI00071DECA2|nr:uncharacterized protein LOC106867884 [Octopus bimaculoides]|eukprot:XP_014768430.1 PREDICTED: uncharacterized protein LOC106867884 [Octopus bimaculoides]
MIHKVKDMSAQSDLFLNVKMTKILVVDKYRTDQGDFTVDGEMIREVDDFVYLGSTISTSGTSTPEIWRRLAIARQAVQDMENIWKSRGVSMLLKIRLLRAVTFSIAAYGCKSLTMLKADEKRVNAFEMWCYRRILSVMDGEKDKQLCTRKARLQDDTSAKHHEVEATVLWPRHALGWT